MEAFNGSSTISAETVLYLFIPSLFDSFRVSVTRDSVSSGVSILDYDPKLAVSSDLLAI